MGLAVAFLLSSFPQEASTPELVVEFLKGSAPAREALELITLPHGLDVRIEDGQLTIFERKK